jgi:stage V sporulation protein S
MAEEETILRVKGSSSATALASAIAHNVYLGKEQTIRAIGAAAVNQAQKAVAIANSYVGPRGMILCTRPGFADVVMPDGTVTAMVFKVIVE